MFAVAMMAKKSKRNRTSRQQRSGRPVLPRVVPPVNPPPPPPGNVVNPVNPPRNNGRGTYEAPGLIYADLEVGTIWKPCTLVCRFNQQDKVRHEDNEERHEWAQDEVDGACQEMMDENHVAYNGLEPCLITLHRPLLEKIALVMWVMYGELPLGEAKVQANFFVRMRCKSMVQSVLENGQEGIHYSKTPMTFYDMASAIRALEDRVILE